MGRPRATRPTDAELAILNVLWEHKGNMTIRQIVASVKARKPSTYATIQTLIRIMEKKGLVVRGPERYPALYSAVAPADTSKKQLVHEFIDRVFAGSLKQLIMHALSAKKVTPSEMNRIEKIIDRMEE